MQIIPRDRRANPRCIALVMTLLGVLLAANAHAKQAPPSFSIESTLMAEEESGGAIDLVFDDEHGLFVLRPSENAIVRLERSGADLVSTTWQDDVSDPLDGSGNCRDLGPGRDTFCFDCEENPLFIYRPLTDATGIEFAAGTLIIPRTSGQLGLYKTSLRLWYVCAADTGPDDPADIAEYGVAPGSIGAFSLKIQAGLTGVVGGVIPDSVGSRTGSGSGGGGSGGGPYPGIDENWDLDANSSYTSIGKDVAIADFNDDDSEDLIILHPEDSAASFLPFLELSGSEETPGGAVFGSAVSFDTTAAPTHAAPGDFDGDGMIDVAIAGSDASIQLHFGDGRGNFREGDSIPVGVEVLALEALDVEQDGRSELLLAGGSDADGGTLIIAGLDASGQSFSQSFPFEGVLSALAVDEFAAVPPVGGGSSTAGLIELVTGSTEEASYLWGLDVSGMGSFPRDLTSLEDIQIGTTHLIALDATGEVFCWGANNHGEITVPSDLAPAADVAAGYDFSVALEQDGSIRCWGRNQYGQCDVPDGIGPVQMVGAGWFNAAAVDVSGRMHVWGSDSNGQNDVPQGLDTIVKFDCGAFHIAALDDEGTVHCWGWNSFGQCDVPSDLGPVIDVAAGYKVTLALLEDGTVRGWGSNAQVDIPDGLEDVVAIDVGEYHAAALLGDGSVVCWGSNSWGATEVPAGLGVASRIACGTQSTFAQSTGMTTTARVHWLDIEATSGNPADLNGDDRVDGEDLLILLGNWNGPGAGDFDASGTVDGADLVVLLGAWG